LKPRRLIWSDVAATDLAKIEEYVRAYDPEAAARLIRRLVDSGGRLAERPAMGRIGRLPGTREWVVPRTKYLLIYKVGEDIVEIHRVMHGARSWPVVVR
jgi:toxin ParE1/3/4